MSGATVFLTGNTETVGFGQPCVALDFDFRCRLILRVIVVPISLATLSHYIFIHMYIYERLFQNKTVNFVFI